MSSSDSYRSAGLIRRLAAIFYDAVVLCAMSLLVTTLLVGLRAGTGIYPQTLAFQLLLLATTWLYFCWFWVHGGQTLGMRAWRLRLVGRDDGTVAWGRASLRFAAAALSLLPLGLGFWWSLVAGGSCWHDRLSSTRLLSEPKPGPNA
jgi:uncharacterized RDD family membrane protein YckC